CDVAFQTDVEVLLVACWRHQNRVDHVDHAVAGGDIGGNDVCVAVENNTGVAYGDRYYGTVNRCGFVERHNIGGHYIATYYVVEKDSLKLLDILGQQQVLDCTSWKLGESLVCRGEYRVWT